MPPMPYYPSGNPTFNEFKKSVYSMNQALFNLVTSARSSYNYHTLYENQPGLNLEIDEKLNKFEKALDYFEMKLHKYHQALITYKHFLGITDIPFTSMDDDNISIDRDILLS